MFNQPLDNLTATIILLSGQTAELQEQDTPMFQNIPDTPEETASPEDLESQ